MARRVTLILLRLKEFNINRLAIIFWWQGGHFLQKNIENIFKSG